MRGNQNVITLDNPVCMAILMSYARMLRLINQLRIGVGDIIYRVSVHKACIAGK
ncbi:MAG: hypothetical protein ABIG42_05125 [bacterium]